MLNWCLTHLKYGHRPQFSRHHQRSHHTRSSTLCSTRSSGESNQPKERSSLTSSRHKLLVVHPRGDGGSEILYITTCKLGKWHVRGFHWDQPRLNPPDPNPQSNNNYTTPITSGIHHQVHVFKLQDTTSNRATYQPSDVGIRLFNHTHRPPRRPVG